MNSLRLFMAGLIVLLGLPQGVSTQEKGYSIKIRVFQIPPIQTVVSGGPAGKGGIIGTQTGGDISTSFPPHVVLIKTDLDSSAPDGRIKQALFDTGYFKEALTFLSGKVGWWPIDDYSIYYSANELGEDSSQRTYHEPPGNSGRNRHAEYWLTLLPKSADDITAILAMKFETGEPSKRLLLDQDISVPLGKIIIVGFPTETQNPQDQRNTRGSIYILAIYVQKTGN